MFSAIFSAIRRYLSDLTKPGVDPAESYYAKATDLVDLEFRMEEVRKGRIGRRFPY